MFCAYSGDIGRLASELVAGINRNRWPALPGIAGRNQADYAALGLVEIFPEDYYALSPLRQDRGRNQ